MFLTQPHQPHTQRETIGQRYQVSPCCLLLVLSAGCQVSVDPLSPLNSRAADPRAGSPLPPEQILARLPTHEATIEMIMPREPGLPNALLGLGLSDGSTVQLTGVQDPDGLSLSSIVFFASDGSFLMEEHLGVNGRMLTFSGGDSVAIEHQADGVLLTCTIQATVPASTVTFVIDRRGRVTLIPNSVHIASEKNPAYSRSQAVDSQVRAPDTDKGMRRYQLRPQCDAWSQSLYNSCIDNPKRAIAAPFEAVGDMCSLVGAGPSDQVATLVGDSLPAAVANFCQTLPPSEQRNCRDVIIPSLKALGLLIEGVRLLSTPVSPHEQVLAAAYGACLVNSLLSRTDPDTVVLFEGIGEAPVTLGTAICRALTPGCTDTRSSGGNGSGGTFGGGVDFPFDDIVGLGGGSSGAACSAQGAAVVEISEAPSSLCLGCRDLLISAQNTSSVEIWIELNICVVGDGFGNRWHNITLAPGEQELRHDLINPGGLVTAYHYDAVLDGSSGSSICVPTAVECTR